MNRELSNLVDSQSQWFEGNMRKIARRVRNRLNTMLNQFDRAGGSLLNTPDNINRLNALYGSIIQELTAAGYTDLVASLNAKENELLAKLRASRPAYAVPLAFTETSQAALAAFSNMWTARIGNLGMDISRQIHSIISESVFSGRTTYNLIQGVSKLLDEDLVRYATTYVNTSRAKFIQMAEYEAAKSYDGEMFWYYEGPEDDVTRPVCREGTGMDSNPITDNAPYYTDAERIDFENYSGSARVYNCRHSFMLISPDYYKEHVGESGKTEEPSQPDVMSQINSAKTEQDFQDILRNAGANQPRVHITDEESIVNARRSTTAIVEIGERYGSKITGMPARITLNDPSLSGRKANALTFNIDSRIHTNNITAEHKQAIKLTREKRASLGYKTWGLSGGDPYGTMIHEYGHAIDNKAVRGTSRDSVVMQSFKRMRAKEKALLIADRRPETLNILTEYGMSSRAEYFAESFAAWHAGKFDIMDKAMIDLFDSLLGGK